MLKKIATIFIRDVKVNLRQTLTLFIMLAPLIIAVGINLISPSINDTTVNIAMIEGQNSAEAEYLDHFAHVSLVSDMEALESRVAKRDHVIGIAYGDSGEYLLAQGNEPNSAVEYAKLLRVLYDSGASLENANTQIVDFGRTIPPLKKMLVNVMLMMIPMLAGMVISLNIVEEKSENTTSAVFLTPVSRAVFVIGKGMIGMVLAVVMSVATLAITGFISVNIVQILLVALASAVIAMLVGFMQGVNSRDIMEAAGSVKLMFLPIAGSIVGYELVTGNWQIFFYWSPFYWAYRANDMVLGKTGTWGDFLICFAVILALCGVFYALLSPRIRKGLEK